MGNIWPIPMSPSKSRGAIKKACADLASSESSFVRSAEGAETQARVWRELGAKLEIIQPDILSNL